MVERCKNCGAELFAGQQFCRKCGAATAALSGENVPTQLLQTGQQQPSTGAGMPFPTAPIPGMGTDTGLGGGYPSAYQPPSAQWQGAGGVAATSALPAPRARRRGWLAALLIICLMGACTLAALLFAIASRTSRKAVGDRVREVRIVQPRPPMPEMPMPPGGHPAGALPGFGTLVDEEDANVEVSPDRTVITRSFELDKGASFSLKNTRGKITIEGWDEQQAEVKITKRGGSKEERDVAQIRTSNDDDTLSLVTVPSSPAVEVEYEIRVPHDLKQLVIASLDSRVNLSDFGGDVSIDIQRGDIELTDIGGEITTKIIKGDTKVTFDDLPAGNREAGSLSSINGDIEVRFEEEMNADLKAETIHGDIEADEDFKLKVENRPVGKQLVGRMGAGGKPIHVKVINGNVKLTK